MIEKDSRDRTILVVEDAEAAITVPVVIGGIAETIGIDEARKMAKRERVLQRRIRA